MSVVKDYKSSAPSAEIVELTEDVSNSPYYNHDMAPTTWAERKWGLKDIAALWISMSACVPTYMLASSLIAEGMNWWQAVLTIFLGNCIVLVPMVLNAHAGTKYGIHSRSIVGSVRHSRSEHPALLRWWRAGGLESRLDWRAAIYAIAAKNFPSLADNPTFPSSRFPVAQFACFMVFWAISMVIYRGIESIRFLLNIKARSSSF